MPEKANFDKPSSGNAVGSRLSLAAKLYGLEILATLRSRHRGIPVLILTARDAVQDRVAGLDAGADDYLVKPFAFPELLARLRALLRLSTIPGHKGDGLIGVGPSTLSGR